jgi:hypothetical protein
MVVSVDDPTVHSAAARPISTSSAEAMARRGRTHASRVNRASRSRRSAFAARVRAAAPSRPARPATRTTTCARRDSFAVSPPSDLVHHPWARRRAQQSIPLQRVARWPLSRARYLAHKHTLPVTPECIYHEVLGVVPWPRRTARFDRAYSERWGGSPHVRWSQRLGRLHHGRQRVPERLRMRMRWARARGVLVPQAMQFGGRLQRVRLNVRMLGRLAQDLRLDVLLPVQLSATP